ncbi:MAG: hypothetical protein P4N60_08935 [Verrucomicrobiae bacterium]|nr:hypothetical protein [Verrucomicrobiae bacterium]
MRAFAKTGPAGQPQHKTPAVPFIHQCDQIAIALFLGMTALIVAFAAASAFETPGTTSIREIGAACITTALYLAFCEFWVAPRDGRGFAATLPTLIAVTAPLLVAVVPWTPWHQGLPWLASGCLGGVAGAVMAQRLIARPRREMPTARLGNRARNCHCCLRAGLLFLAAVALVIPIGVIPSVMADAAHGTSAHTNGIFLGLTVVFDLLAGLVLGLAGWRVREQDHPSQATLGITAFLALFLGLIYCGMGALYSGYGPALRIASFLLFLCAVFSLITTALMTVTSVIVDRARLEQE